MDKVALVTGASRGIGRAIARVLAQEGYAVAVNYHCSKADAYALVDEIISSGGRAAAFCADVSDRSQVNSMAREVEVTLGAVDVLVNNAGIAQQKLFGDITDEDWRAMFGVNVTGAFHCIQAVLPGMIHRKSGAVVNVSSVWGMVGASCEVHYAASKAAIIGLSKALAKELGPSGIRVNCVAPGVIATDMNSALDAQTMAQLSEETPLGMIGAPDDVAAAVSFLVSERARFITGQIISPNGGFVI
ncbi:MAG: elongation factor P 5-aminopentanone reductase [Acetanaerobacterium sp.]